MTTDISTCLNEAIALGLVHGTLEDDAAARARAHAARCDTCRRLVAGVARVVISADDDHGDGDARPLAAGDRVGSYTLIEPLGAGAMGVVFAAHDPTLDRRIAVKLLHEGWDDTGRARLRREARALARLSHPNVVSVLDVGESEQGTYLAMELVDGPSLDRWLAASARSPDQVLEVFAEAGAGMAAAHAQGVVHRDFKPSNVLIGSDGRPRVADFGLAAPTSVSVVSLSATEHVHSDPSLTQTGALAGTPAYMAPEQLDARPADARSDQFAFCVSLWESLEGRRPHDGNTIQALRTAIERRELSTTSRMSRPIRRVLARGLDPDPDRRFDDLNALLTALRHASRGRRRWLAAAAVAGGGALAAAVVLWHAPSEPLEPCAGERAQMQAVWNDVTRARIAQTHDRAAKALSDPGAVTASIDDYVTRWSRSLRVVCTSSTDDLDRDRALRCLAGQRRRVHTLVQGWASGEEEAQIGVPRVLAASTSPAACTDPRQLGAIVALPDDLEAAAEAEALQAELDAIRVESEIKPDLTLRSRVEEAADRARRLGWAPAIAETERMWGTLLYAEGSMVEAEQAFERAYFTALEVDDLATAQSAAVSLVLAVGTILGRHDDGLAWVRHAEALAERLASPARQADVLSAEANLRFEMNDLEQAQALFERAIALVEDDATSRAHTDVMVGLANVLSRQGHSLEAIPHFERAVEAYEAIGGARHPDLVRPLTGLGAALSQDRQYDRAIEVLERAVAIQEAVSGPADIRVAYPLGNLALTYANAGETQRALALHERSHRIFAAVLDDAHPALQQSRYNVAHQHVRLEQWDEAIEYALQALAIHRQRGQPIPPGAWPTLGMLAQAQRGRADYQAAIASWQELVELRSEPPRNLDSLGWTVAELAITLHAAGELEAAQTRYEEALGLYATSHDTSATEKGRVRLALAELLWQRRSRRPARELVKLARTELRESDHPQADARRRETERWLQTHRM